MTRGLAKMHDSILVVCMGNICRSPIGERLLRKYTTDKKISSAGIGALENFTADDKATEIAQRNGLSLAGHKARKITKIMCISADLILVMEQKHLQMLTNIAPEVRGKIMLYGHWNDGLEIPDPYKKSLEAFELVYKMLDKSAQQWAFVLK